MTEQHNSAQASPLKPGDWLGLLGGGQLGRMFCMAAQSMGLKVCVLDPAADGPSADIADKHIQAAFDDVSALNQLADLCAACTTEFENVPASSLQLLSERIAVAPGAHAVSIAQDRKVEKEFVQSCDLECAPFASVLSTDDCKALSDDLFPGILKVARLGYDGKGQSVVHNRQEAETAFEKFGSVACVLEKKLDLACEVSVIVARGFDGDTQAFPVAENIHREGILAVSTVPAQVDDDIAEKARQATIRLADQMQYVGVLCVEFFILGTGQLVINEMAPRPHNSGHYSIDACDSSQFEQQARVLAGWPLGSVEQNVPSVMINLLGNLWFSSSESAAEPDWNQVLRHPRAKLHLYGKRDARMGRKMGHVTVLDSDVASARKLADAIDSALSRANPA